MNTKNVYESPLNSRYASEEMKYIFSPDKKFRTWRRLWVALAEAEMELGLPVTAEQIAELKAHIDDINYADAEEQEKKVRHDVMSHVHAYGLQCPNAKGIIHLGATSCYVGDNTDIIIMHEGLRLIRGKLLRCIKLLRDFAMKYKDMPTLGFTNFQAAQLTTVGKRASLWLWELMMDLEMIDHQLSKAALLGSKGTTGTQASFLELFEGDHEKVKKLQARKIAQYCCVSQEDEILVYYVDFVEEKEELVQINGWVFNSRKESNNHNRVKVLLKREDNGEMYAIRAEKSHRPDLQKEYFKQKEISLAGFETIFSKANLPKGSYQVGLELDKLYIMCKNRLEV